LLPFKYLYIPVGVSCYTFLPNPAMYSKEQICVN